MRITRSRLKEIIMEEVALQEATPDIVDADMHSVETAYFGNAPANQGGMDELEEGIEMITPENIKLVADVVVQMGMNFAPAVIMGALAMTGIKAVEYIKQKASEKRTRKGSAPMNRANERIDLKIQFTSSASSSQ